MIAAADPPSLEPLFLDGPAGRLFAVYHAPPPGAARFDLVYVPPFAEEMNRSRRMAALQARALAARGIGVLLLDPFGTGDSAGCFEDARWPVWQDDVRTAVHWLAHRNGLPVGLWGLRLGALLAASVAADAADVARLVLWSPVVSGETFLTQVLRIRLAAAMGDDAAATEDTTALRQQFRDGESVEVAGYAVPADLALTLDGLRLADLTPPAGMSVRWLELVREEGRPLPLAARRVMDAWTVRGSAVQVAAAVGEPFWSLQEITLAPALIDLTCAALTAEAGG